MAGPGQWSPALCSPSQGYVNLYMYSNRSPDEAGTREFGFCKMTYFDKSITNYVNVFVTKLAFKLVYNSDVKVAHYPPYPHQHVLGLTAAGFCRCLFIFFVFRNKTCTKLLSGCFIFPFIPPRYHRACLTNVIGAEPTLFPPLPPSSSFLIILLPPVSCLAFCRRSSHTSVWPALSRKRGFFYTAGRYPLIQQVR